MRTLVSSLLFTAASMYGVTAQDRVAAVPTEQIEARTLLMAAYPELRTDATTIEVVRGPNGELQFKIAEPIAPFAGATSKPATRALLDAQFEFGRDRRLTRFAAAGPLARASDNAALRTRMRAVALRSADAVPSDERTHFAIQTGATLLAEAPLDEIGQALGVLSVRGIELKGTARGGDSRYGAVWEMSVSARKGFGDERSYTLQFEPYAGRLVGLTRK